LAINDQPVENRRQLVRELVSALVGALVLTEPAVAWKALRRSTEARRQRAED